MPRSLPPPTKKQKFKHQDGNNNEIKQLEAALMAAAQATPPGSLNPLADLLALAHAASAPEDSSRAIYALYRVWVVLIDGGRLTVGEGDGEEGRVVRAWLWDRMVAYQDLLVGLMADPESSLRVSALQILFSLQAHLSAALSASSTPQFHIAHFRKIVTSLLVCPPSPRPGVAENEDGEGAGKLAPDVRDAFVNTYLAHDDVRWFFLRECVAYLKPTHAHAPANLLDILERLRTFPSSPAALTKGTAKWWVPALGAKPKPSKKFSATPTDDSEDEDEEPKDGEDGDDDWRAFFDEPKPEDDAKSKGKEKAAGGRLHRMTLHQSLHALASHRAVFTRAWLALLPLLSAPRASSSATSQTQIDKERERLTIRALSTLHATVLPHLTRAVLVMDWVAACVDARGTVGLLALNALFVLMRDYNLDYPRFYTHLYALLTRALLSSPHRARFLRLAERFLASTHLPAALLASFAKRLSRLSLGAGPGAAAAVVPFVWNMLKTHPALMVMIHRIPDDDNLADAQVLDLYDPAEPDPLYARALESSLWELAALRAHYHAPVATLAKVFGEAFSGAAYAMEDFLDLGYAPMLDTEMKRKIKREPALAVSMRADIFVCVPAGEGEGKEALGGAERDVVSESWAF